MGKAARAASAVLIVLLFGTIPGCQWTGKSDPNRSSNVVFVLHGVDGAGPWYDSLIAGLQTGTGGDEVELVHWGGPLWILANLKLPLIHDAAEDSLADRIAQWRAIHPDGRITLVGHSAGCGVILEALAGAKPTVNVDTVLLLAPAVSEKYDLSPALAHVRGMVHVFYSSHDQLLPSTLVTGTYDSLCAPSAGRHGFVVPDTLATTLRSHLQQHAYNPAWKSLGCEGGHFSWRSQPFVEQVLSPMVTAGRLTAQPDAVLASNRKKQPAAPYVLAAPANTPRRVSPQ